MDVHSPIFTGPHVLKKFQELRVREHCEESLLEFLKNGWKYIDPAPFVGGWHLEAIAEHLQAVTDGHIRRLVINVPPRTSKSTVCSVAWPAWTWAQGQNGPLSGPQVQFLSSSYAQTLSLRDSVKTRRLITSPWYQKHWGSRFVLTGDVNTKGRFENDKGGYRLATSVDGTLTGEGGDVILVDDAHSATEVESDLVRKSTLEWWDEAMSTRLNNQKTGAYVVIMQRLHQEDLTGHIITKESDNWTWLMLPMKHEKERHCTTYVNGARFWEDPRTEEGQLLCPERFGQTEVDNLERRLGPYACNPYEAPVLMADLSLRPIGEIRAGDRIIGFDKKQRDDCDGRHKLTQAVVLQTSSRIAQIVKMTLDSGEVIRCTANHRWFTKDRGPNREMYCPVSLERGSRLARICPPHLPQLSAEDQRLAGWLGGFFDGEGSVSLCVKKGTNYRPSSSVSFYQGSGRNLPLCEKLEHALKHFGFEFSYSEDERKDNKTAACYGYRQYRLMGNDLPMYQRFLHIAQPSKWRDRIIGGALGAKFIKGREKVVSVEPDGEGVVYALTTTTGNYVVWGLASSNSAGQLQQAPAPRGGGIIKEEWWKHWSEPHYPTCEFVLASLDTAYTEKTENDASALTIWGTFRDLNGNPKVILMHSWAERLGFPELVQKVVDSCTIDKRKTKIAPDKRFKIDRLVIESKASGISVAQELHRVIGFGGNFGIELFNPTKMGDKVARAYAVQHLFSEGLIYVPWPSKDGQELPQGYAWVREVLDEVSVFPRGAHDDRVDSMTMGLRWLRDCGFALRTEEHSYSVEEEKLFRGRAMPLYPA